MKKISYINEDGGVSIIIPVDKAILEKQFGPMTDEEHEEHVFLRNGLENKDWQYLNDKDVPSSRIFRNAWQRNRQVIEVSLPKARTIHMDRLRVLRNKQLQELDVSSIRAIELDDAGALRGIKATKKLLRDMPDTETLSELTVEELETYKPVYLDGEL